MMTFYSTTIRDLANTLVRYNGFIITGVFNDNQRAPRTWHIGGDPKRISRRQLAGLEHVGWTQGKISSKYHMAPRRRMNLTSKDFNNKREE